MFDSNDPSFIYVVADADAGDGMFVLILILAVCLGGFAWLLFGPDDED